MMNTRVGSQIPSERRSLSYARIKRPDQCALGGAREGRMNAGLSARLPSGCKSVSTISMAAQPKRIHYARSTMVPN
jgi:hypothetical protein